MSGGPETFACLAAPVTTATINQTGQNGNVASVGTSSTAAVDTQGSQQEQLVPNMPQKRKRGRPRKDEQRSNPIQTTNPTLTPSPAEGSALTANTVPQAVVATASTSATDGTPAPVKRPRGRPPKNRSNSNQTTNFTLAPIPAEGSALTANVAPQAVGVTASVNVSDGSPAPVKRPRGRPPKNARPPEQSSQQPADADPSSGASSSPAVTPRKTSRKAKASAKSVQSLANNNDEHSDQADQPVEETAQASTAQENVEDASDVDYTPDAAVATTSMSTTETGKTKYGRGRPRKDEMRPTKKVKKAKPKIEARKPNASLHERRIQSLLQDPRFRIRYKDGSIKESMFSYLGTHQDEAALLELRDRQAFHGLGPDRSVIKATGQVPTITPCPLIDILSPTQVCTNVRKEALRQYMPEAKTHVLYHVSNQAAVTKPKKMTLKFGTSQSLYSKDPLSSTLTLNTGLDNKTCAWMPSNTGEQYLAVGGAFHHQSPRSLYKYKSEEGCIQLWRTWRDGDSYESELAIILAHDFGICWDLKWMPLATQPDKYLGLLAGCFGNGQVAGFLIEKQAQSGLSYVKFTTPAFAINMKDHHITCFDWQSSHSIVVGCDDGMVAQFDLSRKAHPAIGSLLPTHVAHPQSCYLSHIVSCKPLLPHIVATNGFDGEVCFTDLSGGSGAGGATVKLPRLRSISYCFAWSNLTGALVSSDESGVSVRYASARQVSTVSLTDSLPGLITSAACVQPLLNDECQKLPGVAEHACHPIIALGDASGQVWLYNVHTKCQLRKGALYKRLVCAASYVTQVKPEVQEAWRSGKTIEDVQNMFQPGTMVFLEGLPSVEYREAAVNKRAQGSDDEVDEQQETGKAAAGKKGKAPRTAEDDSEQDFDEEEPKAKGKQKAKSKSKQSQVRREHARSVYHDEVMVRALAWNPNLTIADQGGSPSNAWAGVLATAYKTFVRIEDVGVN
ncbi:hypothetical protein BCR37DRAFT_18079 [Protomyces lactucae-debilis]|uniref:WD40-repeat-containing domain protein n=1 Tax=Protomyces lactucae-debilis TaxID=2754530 RepID=A0A1Y2FXC1_PROLT|nr:uncharacterized protein BCR37DRAFT_18079 [Protomyces lactucae-debilis]ORY87944.1 hypothetical protein BCR37DRAFT_18079 [Protomyces lactucae-debilis]